ncbi:SusC/RagA family TonB-linked outer membrane protein [Niabella ginsengisoli]|uniref:TonB-dependent receptor plug domain-containing protein n=1 Tax=Niabella ginsengisoli TaxID=522298 RepID=A0ABS9SJ99_9BACT|nr:SusC/RagA family TonB-linked outer membrane protein [Niabella ginsengisoli]MCH5598390.1 TonB-dependent receptor plug domain-containing protein [Niabella ginsengisoli]
MERCFREIRKQTGYTFFYERTLIAGEKPVTVNLNQVGLSQALDRIFNGRTLSHTIVDKTIVVKENQPVARTIPAPRQEMVKDPVLIKGRVTDSEGQGIEGVTVQVKNDVHASVTGPDGTFAITVPDVQTAVLIFSHINMQPEELAVKGQTNVSISLKSKIVEQQEVVIVGYGTQKKSNVTGAVSTVKVEELLGNRPVATTGALLQGAAAGLQVNIGSGEPGAPASFNIRGATDIQAGSNTIRTTGPFIIVDNMPFNGPLNLLDPNDIETVTVLKDAGSAAIYGARSAFGVVLVTTKKGAKNQKVRFDYSNNLTMVQATNLPRKASVLETVQSYKDMGAIVYRTGNDVDTWLNLINEYNQDPSRYPDGYTIVEDVRYPLRGYDAMKNLLGSNPLQFMHNLSVSGGSEKTTYRFSLGTVKENGVLAPDSKQDMYRRYNFKSSVTTEVKKWLTIQADAAYYNSLKSYPISDGLNTAINFAPYVPMEDSLEIGGVNYLSESPKNVVTMRAPSVDKTDDIRLTGRIILRPVTDLTLTAEYTHDNLQVRNTFYQKITTAPIRASTKLLQEERGCLER